MLWLDICRPNNVDSDKSNPKIVFHQDVYFSLRTLISHQTFIDTLPHLLFFGPEGSGKSTLLRLCIQHVSKCSDLMLMTKLKTIEKSESKISDLHHLSYLQSPFHIELSPEQYPSTVQSTLIQHFVKNICQQQQLSFSFKLKTNVRSASKSVDSSSLDSNTLDSKSVNWNPQSPPTYQRPKYQFIVIHGIEKWSLDAQHALRRILEQSYKTARFIFTSQNLTRVLMPIQSRCFPVRLARPPPSLVRTWLLSVLVQMNIRKTKSGQASEWIVLGDWTALLIASLVRHEKGHLHRCMLLLQQWFSDVRHQMFTKKANDIKQVLSPQLLSVWMYRAQDYKQDCHNRFSQLWKEYVWLILEGSIDDAEISPSWVHIPGRFYSQLLKDIVQLIKFHGLTAECVLMEWCEFITSKLLVSSGVLCKRNKMKLFLNHCQEIQQFGAYSMNSEAVQILPRLQLCMARIALN